VPAQFNSQVLTLYSSGGFVRYSQILEGVSLRLYGSNKSVRTGSRSVTVRKCSSQVLALCS
jgi:hypothetical protein